MFIFSETYDQINTHSYFITDEKVLNNLGISEPKIGD